MCVICLSLKEFGDIKDARLMITKAAGEPNDIKTEHLIDLTIMLDDIEDDNQRKNNS